MKDMKILDVVKYLDQLIPAGYQESYDNCGLQVGDTSAEVTGVLISLDLTEAVVDEAVETRSNLIVTHHPFIFTGLKRIDADSPAGRVIYKLIRNGIAVYSAHTSLDKLSDGVSAQLAKRLGLNNLRILAPDSDSLKQLVVYCPKEQSQQLKDALYAAGAGNIGNYRHCSYSVEGTGTFEPLQGANPFIGKVGNDTATAEERIEMVYPKAFEGRIVASLLANHPYETPAYSLIPLSNANPDVGLGMIGEFQEGIDIETFIKKVKQTVGIPVVRHSELCRKTVRTVALCGGAGAEFIGTAMAQNADIYLTGDLKYHDFQKAAGRIVVADIGHYESEQFAKEFFYDKLSEKFRIFAIRIAKTETNFVGYM